MSNMEPLEYEEQDRGQTALEKESLNTGANMQIFKGDSTVTPAETSN